MYHRKVRTLRGGGGPLSAVERKRQETWALILPLTSSVISSLSLCFLETGQVLFIYLFSFGCVGSSLLHTGFL